MKRMGFVLGVIAVLSPALARAEFKEMKQSIFGMD
jgi:hypothetical protein